MGSKRLKNGEKGYETYLPKSLVSRYHNTREVATHKIRNTVTHGSGNRPPASGIAVPAVCP